MGAFIVQGTYIVLLGITLLSLGIALFLQYVVHWQPCTLCLIDRGLLWILAALFIMVIARKARGKALHKYTLGALLLSGLGIMLSIRHLWLLDLPEDKMPICTPGLHYLLETLPLKAAVVTFLKSGECAKNPAVFLMLPLPLWTLLTFVALTLGIIFAASKNR